MVSGKMAMGIGFYHGNGFMGMGGNGNRNSPSRTPLVEKINQTSAQITTNI